MVNSSSTASGFNCFVRITDLIPSRYGVLFEVDDYPARQPSDRVTFSLLMINRFLMLEASRMVMIWEFVSSVSACLHIYVMYIYYAVLI
jgi:hypothetical protein